MRIEVRVFDSDNKLIIELRDDAYASVSQVFELGHEYYDFKRKRVYVGFEVRPTWRKMGDV